MDAHRFEEAIAAIDAVNAQDPTRVVVGGVEGPKELLHGEAMTEWVLRLDPAADEAQLLAARAHHLRRWAVPRSSYPEGRSGYLQWRTALRKRHAEEVGQILGAAGIGPEVTDKVQRIVGKVGLGTDPDVAVHEDALCLVFLTTQFDELIDRLGGEHSAKVVAKTLAKMSERGRAEALALPLSVAGRAVVQQALDA